MLLTTSKRESFFQVNLSTIFILSRGKYREIISIFGVIKVHLLGLEGIYYGSAAARINAVLSRRSLGGIIVVFPKVSMKLVLFFIQWTVSLDLI